MASTVQIGTKFVSLQYAFWTALYRILVESDERYYPIYGQNVSQVRHAACLSYTDCQKSKKRKVTYCRYTVRSHPDRSRYLASRAATLSPPSVKPRGRVVQPYPQVPGNHFSRLLRPEWAAAGLIIPRHHTKSTAVLAA